MEKDTRVQLPVYWSELSNEAQEDLSIELSAKLGVCRLELLCTLVRMDKQGREAGHVVVYEYEIKKEMGLD